MAPTLSEFVIKVLWILISFLSFIFLSIISQQLLDPYYPIIVSSVPGNLFACGLFFFVVSICCSILSYFYLFLSDGPLSILLNVSSASLFCFFTLAFAACFGTKIFFTQTDAQVYQNSIVLCSFESVICDQFKQTIGDITMSNKELQGLATQYVQKRTLKAAGMSLLIMTIWIIIHSVFLNYLFNSHDDTVKKYNKAAIEENDVLSDNFDELNEVEKEAFN